MKSIRLSISVLSCFFILVFINCCTSNKEKEKVSQEDRSGNFFIGWSSVDITPDKPVLLSGQFHARVSESINDPIYATALAMENVRGSTSEKAILISCDLVGINDGMRDGSVNNLRDNVRNMIVKAIPELSHECIILNATHTHTAPYVSVDTDSEATYGVKLDAMSPSECMEFISGRIAKAAEQAWENRKPGGISYGLGHAVVARNRIQALLSGVSVKGGSTNKPEFSHVEGYEDHTINLLYTWDNQLNLTGVIINIAADSQVTGGEFFVSADFWHDTRLEVKRRLGKDVYILPQCSAAGDQGTLILVGAKAEQRMQEIIFPVLDTTIEERIRPRMSRRKQIASQITDAVTSVFPYMKDRIDWDPVFAHQIEKMELSRRLISLEEVNKGQKEAEEYKKQYDKLLLEINQDPEIRKKPRWYRDVTRIHTMMKRGLSVKERYELEKKQPKLPVEIHVLRIGDIAIATNPFELYLDYAMRIKARSAAIQTFVVQLAGSGTYLPAARSVAGGAYGAVPESNLVGPEGGQELVEKTLELINKEFPVKK